MWIIGFVALSQVIYLPGAVLFRLLKITSVNLLEKLAGVIAASLIANCVLVTILVSVGLHKPAVWWLIIFLETGYLAKTYQKRGSPWRVELRWLAGLPEIDAETIVAAIAFLSVLIVFTGFLIQNWGSVYVGNDDVANWDRWASEWASNRFPTQSSIYPQLLPANGSISYVLLGAPEVKMFSKAITPIYSLLTILLFLSLAICRREVFYLWGGALFGFLVVHYTGVIFPTYGYADLPFAFFAFLAFYCVYRNRGTPSRDEVVAGLIASAGALLVKQGALYVVVAMVCYAIVWQVRQRERAAEANRAPARILGRDLPGLFLVILLVFSFTWYAVKMAQILNGHEFSNVQQLTQGIHQGRNFWQRLVAAWRMFYNFRPYTGPLVTVSTAVLLLTALFLRKTRTVTLAFLMPYLLLYGLLFSYEIRNGLMAFPLIALVCCETLHELAAIRPGFVQKQSANRVFSRYRGVLVGAIPVALIAGWLLAGAPGQAALPAVASFLSNPWIFEASHLFGGPALVISLLILSLSFVIRVESGAIEVGRFIALALIVFVVHGAAMNSREGLIASQLRQARTTIGDPVVNERLYATIRQKHITAGIVTDYWFLSALPEINGLFRRTNCGAPCTVDGLRASVAAHPDAQFVLMLDGNLAPEARDQIERGGEFNNLFLIDGVRFFRVRRGLNGRPRDQSLPSLLSISPAAGSGAEQEFRLIFTDSNGAEDISDIILIINSRWQPAGACYVQWNRDFNSVTLANDCGVGWAAEKLIGKPGSAENAQCKIDTGRIVVEQQENQIELRIPIHFAPSFAGRRHFYATAVQRWTGVAAPYKDGANWVVP